MCSSWPGRRQEEEQGKFGAPGSSGNASKFFLAGLGVCFVGVARFGQVRRGRGAGKEKKKTVGDSSQQERGKPRSPGNDGPWGLARA